MAKLGGTTGRMLGLVIVLLIIGCGNGTEPTRGGNYFYVIRDRPCGGPAIPDTISQPDVMPPNAGWGHLDVSSLIPARGLLWILGSSRQCLGRAASFTFVLTRTPLPTVGRYAIEPVEDSTVYLSNFNVPCVPMFAIDVEPASPLIAVPFTGTLDVTRVTTGEVEGVFHVEGAYNYDEQEHCLDVEGRFLATVTQPST